MICKSQFPTVSRVGQKLELEGLLVFNKGKYYQTAENCFGIASRVAKLFGYQPLTSKRELFDLMKSFAMNNLWGKPLDPRFTYRSPVCLVIRMPDGVDTHVSIEAFGREYNYGANNIHGYQIQYRIPLYTQSEFPNQPAQ